MLRTFFSRIPATYKTLANQAELSVHDAVILASIIQKEVQVMIEDVVRLNDRIAKLRSHFDQANKDIEMIETSGTKISRRGEKITALEVEDSKTDKEKISDTTNDLLSSQPD